MYAYIDGTTTQPSWLTYDALTNEWLIRTTNPLDKGSYLIRQFIELADTLNQVPKNTKDSSITFTVTLNNPCEVGNYIIQQNGAGESFDSANDVPTVFLISTSVLYGTDVDPLGIKRTFQFMKHDDYVSSLYRASSGLEYCCGQRVYTVAIIEKSPNDGSPMGTFAEIYDVTATTDQTQIAIYTDSDTDIGSWRLQITVQLLDYSNIDGLGTTYVTGIYEYAWVEIQSCIVNQIIKKAMTASKQAILDGYFTGEPLQVDIYNQDPTMIQVNQYQLSPLCSYTLKFETIVQNHLAHAADMTAANTIIANPNLGFQTEVFSLDQAEYGLVDPATGITDYSQVVNKNPYLITHRAYIENYNPASLEFENTELELYVWPKNVCNEATITPDPLINGGIPYIYFIGDTIKPIQVTRSIDSVSTSLTYGVEGGSGFERCGDRSYEIVKQFVDDFSEISYITGD